MARLPVPTCCRPTHPRTACSCCAKGLAETYKDLRFIADAQKARLDMDPLSGEELERVVARTYKLEKPIIEKLKEILK